MITAEFTVLEKLFHEDQPMGDNGTGISFAAGCAHTFIEPLRNVAASIGSKQDRQSFRMKFIEFDTGYECIRNRSDRLRVVAEGLAVGIYTFTWRDSCCKKPA